MMVTNLTNALYNIVFSLLEKKWAELVFELLRTNFLDTTNRMPTKDGTVADGETPRRLDVLVACLLPACLLLPA